jgi:hypothetical protein
MRIKYISLDRVFYRITQDKAGWDRMKTELQKSLKMGL